MAKKPVDFDGDDDGETKVKKEAKGSVPKTKSSSGDSSIVELDMNLDEYEDFEPLPAGGYPFTVTKAEMRTSDKGNDFYYTTLQIHPDDYPPDYDPSNAPDGLNLVHARMQKPDPKNRRSITAVRNFMGAIGLSTKTPRINPAEWEGKKGKVVIKIGKYNGEPINEIVAIEGLDD